MHVCLILFPGFPTLGYVLIREILRLANACAGQPLFSCRVRTVTGAPVRGNDGIEIAADENDWEGAQGFDLVVLCAGADSLGHLPMGLRGFLARAAAAEACLAGLDGGAVILARLGFLAGREAALPEGFDLDPAQTRGAIAQSARPHVFDRQRLTATGGIATGEALLEWVARVHGAALSAAVSAALAHGRLRAPPVAATGLTTEDPLLSRMLSIMGSHLSDPLPLTRVAAELEVSAKQLRLRCRKAFSRTPGEVYLALRLARAQHLVLQTQHSVAEIALATGFVSASAFTRSYRRHFGETPRVQRLKPGAARKPRPPAPPATAPEGNWTSAHAAAQPSVASVAAARRMIRHGPSEAS